MAMVLDDGVGGAVFLSLALTSLSATLLSLLKQSIGLAIPAGGARASVRAPFERRSLWVTMKGGLLFLVSLCGLRACSLCENGTWEDALSRTLAG